MWTGASLKDNFEVDHVIPFDLWHNNDSWNLLPASKLANTKKSNSLPSADMLKKRKNEIVTYWEILLKYERAKFTKEAETLLVLPEINWQNLLFSQMSVAIEMTAFQRGVKRWGC